MIHYYYFFRLILMPSSVQPRFLISEAKQSAWADVPHVG